MLQKTQSQLKLLTRERDSLRQRLASVEATIRHLSGGGAPATGERLKAGNTQTLLEALSNVLTKAGKPLSVIEIMEKVEASGYRSRAANFRGLVNQTLHREKKIFARTGRGTYALKK
jgi:hypothetical protein